MALRAAADVRTQRYSFGGHAPAARDLQKHTVLRRQTVMRRRLWTQCAPLRHTSAAHRSLGEDHRRTWRYSATPATHTHTHTHLIQHPHLTLAPPPQPTNVGGTMLRTEGPLRGRRRARFRGDENGCQKVFSRRLPFGHSSLAYRLSLAARRSKHLACYLARKTLRLKTISNFAESSEQKQDAPSRMPKTPVACGIRFTGTATRYGLQLSSASERLGSRLTALS